MHNYMYIHLESCLHVHCNMLRRIQEIQSNKASLLAYIHTLHGIHWEMHLYCMGKTTFLVSFINCICTCKHCMYKILHTFDTYIYENTYSNRYSDIYIITTIICWNFCSLYCLFLNFCLKKFAKNFVVETFDGSFFTC